MARDGPATAPSSEQRVSPGYALISSAITSASEVMPPPEFSRTTGVAPFKLAICSLTSEAVKSTPATP